MVELKAHKLQYLISSIAMIETGMAVNRWKNSSGPVALSMYGGESSDMSKQFDFDIALLESIGLDSCASVLGRAKVSYVNQGKPGHSEKQLEDLLADVRHQMYDELKRPVFLVLSSAEKTLFEQVNPLFGQEVATKFPSISYEIQEAGKCLALGRSTASAFHSIRSLEAGIRAIARCLGIPDPTKGSQRSWHNILGSIDTEMKKRWATSASRFVGDGKTFEELHGALVAMQDPYRNATAHLDAVYTEGEARHVMELVKGILARIATRMDETGSPLA